MQKAEKERRRVRFSNPAGFVGRIFRVKAFVQGERTCLGQCHWEADEASHQAFLWNYERMLKIGVCWAEEFAYVTNLYPDDRHINQHRFALQ